MGREREKTIPSVSVFTKKIPQEKQQLGLSGQCDNLALSSNNESSDEEEDNGTTWKICKIPWIELAQQWGDWVQCDICDKYIGPKCYDKRDISADEIFI